MVLTLAYEALSLLLFCTINGHFDPININDTSPKCHIKHINE